MKKCIALVLMLVLTLSLAVPALSLNSLDNYVTGSFNNNYSVYSGPGTEYYRANSGKALVGSGSTCRIFGVVDNGWVMIGYGLSNGDYRIGYISGESLKNIKTVRGNINYSLRFNNEVMYTRVEAPVTDDPILKFAQVAKLPANTQVVALGTLGDYVYVELTYQNARMRGFIRSDRLKNQSGGSVQMPVATQKPAPAPTQKPSSPNYTGNALLSSLTHNCPNTGIMIPSTFSPYQTTYLLTVADWVSRPTFTPVSYDPNAIITVNGTAIRSGQTYSNLSMTDKPQAVTITVTSGNASTSYTIYLQRRPSEKRTRISAGYVNRIYFKNNEWRIDADLGTVTYTSDNYSTGSQSSFQNKTVETNKYDYVVSPNCLFYYGTPQNPIRLSTVTEFMNYYFAYGSSLYTFVYIEDEIVAVMPYGADYMAY